jgi:H+/gluconate symporter-like permease
LPSFSRFFCLALFFGKLMDDTGSVTAVADYMTNSLGKGRAMLAVVLAGAIVTYGGVSLFVAFFVLAPMAQALFRAEAIPSRLMPAAIVLGTSTFTMSALPGTPSIQNAIPKPFFGTTAFAAPGLGIIASLIMLGFGLWWLHRRAAPARAMAASRRTYGSFGTNATSRRVRPPLPSGPHEFRGIFSRQANAKAVCRLSDWPVDVCRRAGCGCLESGRAPQLAVSRAAAGTRPSAACAPS